MEYPKLYKRAHSGKIIQWWAEREENAYRFHSSQVGGKVVTSGWRYAESKNVDRSNETTPEQQAELEITSNYTQQRDSGYVDDISLVGDTPVFSPMLAKDYKDMKGISFPVYSQPKLDGFRAVFSEENQLLSRNRKPFLSSPHIIRLLEEHLRPKYPTLIVDGELYNHALKDNFNKIASLVAKKKPTEEDLQEAAQLVEYHVFDVIVPGSFADRLEILKEIEAMNIPMVKVVRTDRATSQEELDHLYFNVYIQDGYEGQMIRNDTPYEMKRTKNLIKRKEFMDEEFTILDIGEGVGNWSGMAKEIYYERNGIPFRSGLRGTQEWARKLLAEKNKYIGSQATVRYQNLTPDGKPRFPVTVMIYEGKRDV